MIDTEVPATVSASAATAVIDRLRAGSRSAQGARKPITLSPEALEVAATHAAPPMSPIVLAGFVRMIELALIAVVGLTVYAVYLFPTYGIDWLYIGAIAAVAALSMLAFQVADIYQVQAFRGHEKQYMRLASAWSVVFLIVIGASFFAKFGDHFSRIWLGSFYALGLISLIVSRRILFLLVRRWTREGRLARRTVIVGGGDAGTSVIEALRRQKDTGVEIIGVFDDRGDARANADCAGHRKLGSVDDLVEFGRRTR
ncbi:MAG: undecaprenyl-phosphate glucose phosphotransferase, partial [Pseudolabrys sp.]